MVFGTLTGDVVVTNAADQVSHHFREGLAATNKLRPDAILGLCWLRKHHNRFVAGSSYGVISLCDISEQLSPAEPPAGPSSA